MSVVLPAIKVGEKKSTCKLADKLALHEETIRQHDKAAAAGVVLSGSVLCTGEKLQIFSSSAGSWVPGVVTELVDGDARVRYEVGGARREKLVATVSTELRRTLVTAVDPTSNGTRTGRGRTLHLTPPAMVRAKAALMRMPSSRTLNAIRELVEWTYSVDLFHGLNLAERQKLCMEVTADSFDNHQPLVQAAQAESAIQVLFSGSCAVYTMRVVDKVVAKKVLTVDSASKFTNMQRRVSVAVRAGSVIDQFAEGGGGSGGSLAERRQSIAVAVMTDETEDASPPTPPAMSPGVSAGRRVPVAPTAEQQMSVAQAPTPLLSDKTCQERMARSGLAGGPLKSSTKLVREDGVSFPVQLRFGSTDAIGVKRSFHNADIMEHNKGVLQYASHTVVALEDCIAMTFRDLSHLKIFKRGFDRSQVKKVELLTTVPNYAHCSRECLHEMATFTRRVWHPSRAVLISQGSQSLEIYYIVTGSVRVVLNFGAADEKVLNIIGPGSCFGDWGVVNNKPRGATCITETDSELLLINDFNFKATADQDVSRTSTAFLSLSLVN